MASLRTRRNSTVLVWSSLLLITLHGATGFILPLQSPRTSSVSALDLQVPVDLVSSLAAPFHTPANLLVEDVSWRLGTNLLALDLPDNIALNDIALYGGLPLAALALLLNQPPARLLSPTELQAITDQTNLQGRDDVMCLYKASRDGWTATDFHDKVDTRGSAVVVARSLTGQVFGGYNPAGWRSTDDYVTSTAAFLWCRNGGDIAKFPILPGGNAAVFDFATAGPTFGAADLVIGASKSAVMGGFAGPDAEDISTSAGNLRQAKVAPGVTYDVTAAWKVRGNVVLSEVEVYGRP